MSFWEGVQILLLLLDEDQTFEAASQIMDQTRGDLKARGKIFRERRIENAHKVKEAGFYPYDHRRRPISTKGYPWESASLRFN
jgi:hypothetical protein